MHKLNGFKILVVEDDLDLIEVMCDLLSSANASVLRATNGEQALALLETEKVNFILSDIEMPIMDGIALLNHIQKGSAQKPPLLFVTGHATVTEAELKNSGAVGLIRKPFKKEVLLQVLAELLLEDHYKKGAI